MDNAKSQLADKLKGANNILVTVSRDPSVDQLAACIGLTLLLNKLNKHAAAIFSGQIPSTIEFLQPEETLEKNTDSLRDFIISLDKSKADKLRYKVEDNVVRIFITPYRTSIGQGDLEFSEGDFNVDVVVALGVKQQEDLDNAITAHGRILHDATVASINLSSDGGLGSIGWHDSQASSLSELVTELAQAMGKDLIDAQIATALLTGIVAATERFSNDKTSSQTMSMSSVLMSAGANQQLVATKLEEPSPIPRHDSYQKPPERDVKNEQPPALKEVVKHDDGTLEIKHEDNSVGGNSNRFTEMAPPPPSSPPPTAFNAPKADISVQSGTHEPPIISAPAPAFPKITLDEHPLPGPDVLNALAGQNLSHGANYMKEAPALDGTLTANSAPENLDPSTDPFSLPSTEPSRLLDRTEPSTAASPPLPTDDVGAPPPPPPSFVTPPPPPPPVPRPNPAGFTPPPPAWVPPTNDPFNTAANSNQTLTEIEESVNSPHIQSPDLDEARDEVNRALEEAATDLPEPNQVLNAQPLGNPLHNDASENDNTEDDQSNNGSLPPPMTDTPLPPGASFISPSPVVSDPNAPPPVPPPITFQYGNPGGSPPS